MPRFEKLKPGMKLRQVTKQGEYPVDILEVYPEKRSAKVVWNGNVLRPTTMGEGELKKLRYDKER